MSIFSVTLQDSSGNARTGLDVDLYYDDGTGSKFGDMTDADNDGVYIIDVTVSGEYTVKVGGVAIAELTSIFIPAEDIETHLAAANPHSSSASDSDLDAVKGAGWTTETVKDNADDIADNASDISTNASAITAVKGTGWTADMTLKGHDDSIGDLDFEATVFLTNITTITNALRELDKQVANAVNGSINKVLGTRHVASDVQVAGAAAGNTASDPSIFTETSTSYVKKVKVNLPPNRGNINNIKAFVIGSGYGTIKLSICESDGTEQDSNTIDVSAVLGGGEISVSNDSFTAGSYICLEMKADSGQTLNMSHWEIYMTEY